MKYFPYRIEMIANYHPSLQHTIPQSGNTPTLHVAIKITVKL